MRNVNQQLRRIGLTLVLSGSLCSCTTASRIINPFYEPPSDVALQGQANDHALNGKTQREDSARQALEQMASYQREKSPEPVKPVVQPAVVRLMWVPDHLNSHGDLVPAHYYYLKVLKDRWAVTDAFELEGQLGKTTSSQAIPFVREDDLTRK